MEENIFPVVALDETETLVADQLLNFTFWHPTNSTF
jgi:hypothetical protein